MEPTEIREEVREQFENEEHKEMWINYLAMTTVLLAVCATLASFKLEHFSVEAVLKQAQASDKWAYFQAKSVKGYMYEIQKAKLELDLKGIEKSSGPDLVGAYRKDIESYGAQVKKYEAEKEEITKEAKLLEKERDECQEKREIFGMSIIFLQMGILLCSIAALMRKKYIWLVASAVGLVGIAYFAHGFFHFL